MNLNNLQNNLLKKLPMQLKKLKTLRLLLKQTNNLQNKRLLILKLLLRPKPY